MLLSRVLGVVIIVLGAATAFTYYNWQNELEERIRIEAKYYQLNLIYESQAKQVNQLNSRLAFIQSERDVAVSKLNGYRNREEVLLKRPESVERLANAATKRLFADFKAATDTYSKNTSAASSTSPAN